MPAVSVSPSTSTQIVAVNYNRTIVVVTNAESVGGANIHFAFGRVATTDDAYLAPGGNMTITGDARCLAAINGLSSSGTATAKYTELSTGS